MKKLSSSYSNMDRAFDANLKHPTEQFLTSLHIAIDRGEGWVGPLENEVDLIILFTAHHILKKTKGTLSNHLNTLISLNDQPIEFSQHEANILLRALLYQNGKRDYSKYLNIVRRKCPKHVGM